MYSFDFNNVKADHELTELVKMFMPSTDFRVLSSDPADTFAEAEKGRFEAGQAGADGHCSQVRDSLDSLLIQIPDQITDKEEGKRYIYDTLSRITGKTIAWGILTGIRPVKLTGELFKELKDSALVKESLKKDFYIRDDKAQLLIDIRKRQEVYLENTDEKAISLYIGIPFCPSRCLYCSFPAYVGTEDKLKAYLKALYMEIEAIGALMEEKGLYPETIYIGGGTPSSLTAEDLSALLEKINISFDISKLKEFTLEAGRPDTITADKLLEIKDKGVDRISINPQTSKEKTLELIGRYHTNKELYRAFDLAKTIGFKAINADLIVGLPEETISDFEKSLRDIMDLGPENITIHTLAVKRASRLKGYSPLYNYRQGSEWEEMLDLAGDLLGDRGYKPYYLYRQKQMMGNLENVGYSLPGKEGVYNIKIMEENQTIIALGAGGVSKVFYPEENRLERVANVSNYEVYIDRIDQMIERKRKEIG